MKTRAGFGRASLLLFLLALVGCDHTTKYIAKSELQHRAPHAVLGSLLDLRYTENTDVAFNALRFVPEVVRGPMLVVTGAATIVLLLAIMLRRSGTPAVRLSLVLLLAGALGNFSDRLVRGYVVDFIHVPHWPVFNVADICVTAGAVLLGWTAVRRRRVHSDVTTSS